MPTMIFTAICAVIFFPFAVAGFIWRVAASNFAAGSDLADDLGEACDRELDRRNERAIAKMTKQSAKGRP